MTQSSATITGSGTAFSSAVVGGFLRVTATHSTVPFVFISKILAVGSGTSLTLTRPFPASADTASGLSYAITLAERTIVLRYPHAVDASAPGELMWGTSDCTSNTEMYLNPFGAYNTFASAHDVLGPFGSLDGLHVTTGSCSGCGVYSITDSTSWVNEGSAGGISFYGESLANRVLGLRSGLTSAYTAANEIADYWMKSPWGNADGNGFPRLFLGGEGIGTIAHAVIDSVPALWPEIRGYANLGVVMACGQAASSTGLCATFYASTQALGCNANDDTRDTGYAYSWLILAAIYDPDTSSTGAPGGIPWRTYWQSALAVMQSNDNACQNQTASSNNSFANGTYWNSTSFPVVTMTNGSATVTSSSSLAGICNATSDGTGTATVTNGSNAITIISGSVPGGTTNLFLTGTTGSGATVFIQSLAYSGGALGANWLGRLGYHPLDVERD